MALKTNTRDYIKNILVTGDIWRSNDAGFFTQDGNIMSLHRLIRFGVRNLELDIEILKSSASLSMVPYKNRRINATWNNWAKLFYSHPEHAELQYYEFISKYTLVIGFELSPFFIFILRHFDVPFINIRISPIRFMEERLFTISSDISVFDERLRSLEVNQDFLKQQSNRVIAKHLKNDLLQFSKDTIIIAGQTNNDRVLINKDGTFDSLSDYQDYLAEFVKDYEEVIYKPHPLAEKSKAPIPGIKIFEGGFYRICSQPAVKTVLSLSSSTSIEANYFECIGHQIMSERYKKLMNGWQIVNNLDDEDFWNYIFFGGCQNLKTAPKLISLSDVFK